MVINIEPYNGTKQESAANTLTYENVEVPNSAGAKSVHLVRAECEPQTTEHVANTTTTTGCGVCIGKIVPTVTNLSQVGMITKSASIIVSNGTSAFAAFMKGPGQAAGRWPIFKNSDDGKYYFTIAVQSVGNTAAKSGYFRCDFEVDK